jgi:hypothetical protein
MPLQLNKLLNSGVTAGYFRLANLHCNVLRSVAVVGVNMYLTRAAFNAGSTPIDQLSFEIPLDITSFNNVMNTIETALKADPYFAGAVDSN